jgi:hypothetical protein
VEVLEDDEDLVVVRVGFIIVPEPAELLEGVLEAAVLREPEGLELVVFDPIFVREPELLAVGVLLLARDVEPVQDPRGVFVIAVVEL